MYKLFLILILGISSLYADMYWAEDYKSGVKEAAKNHKNILVYFSKEECVKCEEMTWTISFDKNVSDYVDEHFIAIEIDVEFDKRQGYKVYETPTIYFLDAKAKKIGKPMTGTLKPKKFLQKLKDIVDSTKQ